MRACRLVQYLSQLVHMYHSAGGKPLTHVLLVVQEAPMFTE